MGAQSFRSLFIQKGKHTIVEPLPLETASAWNRIIDKLSTIDGSYCQPERLEKIDRYHAFVEQATQDKKAYLSLRKTNLDQQQFLLERELAIGHITVQWMLLFHVQQDPSLYSRSASSITESIRAYQERWIRTHDEEFGYLLRVREQLPTIRQKDALVMRSLFRSSSWLP
jgi:lysyl-tRNA synthetase class II